MTDKPDPEILAGEYVLGLLDGEDRRIFAARLMHDAALDTAVARWEERLAPIDATANPVRPSDGLWPRIEQALTTQQGRELASSPAAALSERLGHWWNSLPLWRGMSLVGAAAVVLLAVGLGAALDRARRQPVMVAVLLTDNNVAAAVVNTFADGRGELLPLQDIDVPQGRALEIWTLWDRAVGPRSVGLIERARAAPLRLDNLPLGNDQLFEITVEPASGSPTGRPTGPIIAKGLTARRL